MAKLYICLAITSIKFTCEAISYIFVKYILILLQLCNTEPNILEGREYINVQREFVALPRDA